MFVINEEPVKFRDYWIITKIITHDILELYGVYTIYSSLPVLCDHIKTLVSGYHECRRGSVSRSSTRKYREMSNNVVS